MGLLQQALYQQARTPSAPDDLYIELQCTSLLVLQVACLAFTRAAGTPGYKAVSGQLWATVRSLADDMVNSSKAPAVSVSQASAVLANTNHFSAMRQAAVSRARVLTPALPKYTRASNVMPAEASCVLIAAVLASSDALLLQAVTSEISKLRGQLSTLQFTHYQLDAWSQLTPSMHSFYSCRCHGKSVTSPGSEPQSGISSSSLCCHIRYSQSCLIWYSQSCLLWYSQSCCLQT